MAESLSAPLALARYYHSSNKGRIMNERAICGGKVRAVRPAQAKLYSGQPVAIQIVTVILGDACLPRARRRAGSRPARAQPWSHSR
jgi:hypothetical protein